MGGVSGAGVESWAPIPDVSGYEASSLGRIRSLDRVVHYRNGQVRNYRGRILKSVVHPQTGYLQVGIGNRRSALVHRLVLFAFVGPAPEGMECRHLNGNRTDARLQNLTWGTAGENSLDKVRHGRHHRASSATCIRGHVLVLPNLNASILAQGFRSCRACHRGHSTVGRARHRGIPLDMQAVSDEHYSRIMSENGHVS